MSRGPFGVSLVNSEAVSPISQPKQQDEGAALALLYLIANEVHSYLDLDSVLYRVLMATISTMDTPGGSLYVFDESGKISHRLVIKNWLVEDGDAAWVDTIVEQGLAGWVIRHQRGAIVANTAQDERWYSQADEVPRSAIAAPLQTRAGVIGVLTLVHGRPGYFSDTDLAMLTVIADQAATAVVNARLFQAEQRRRQLAATLAEVSRTMSATLDIDRLFDVILEQLARVIHYDSASILLQEEDGLHVVAARGFDQPEALLGYRLKSTQENPALRAVHQREAMVVDDVQLDPDWQVTQHTQHVRGWIGAPLVTQDEVVGVLAVDSHQPHAYTDEDAQVVSAFAHQAAIALSNAHLVEQLQAAETRYARLFEDNTDILFIFDSEGRLLDANRKACEVLERDKSSLVGSDVGSLAAALRGEFDNARPCWQAGDEVVFEIDLPVASGRVVPIEFQTKRIDYGGSGSIQWSGRDTSARRELEQLRQDLTNMLVHDMRGPMGNLMSAIRTIPMVMEQATEDSPMFKLLDIALRSGQQMQDLIDSMLDVSRLEQRRVPLSRTQRPVSSLLQAVEDQLGPVAQARQIELDFEAEGHPSLLWIDQDMIRRVLTNLVSNAVKYSPRRGRIRLAVLEQEGHVQFSVSDQGPGIPPQYHQSIFEKFARVEYEGAPKGVGLGLAFCRLAVEAHGGRIWVESTPGQGSTFSFRLPILEPPVNAETLAGTDQDD
jgi:NtrC-family two-component system sensor histidine kinase KinB